MNHHIPTDHVLADLRIHQRLFRVRAQEEIVDFLPETVDDVVALARLAAPSVVPRLLGATLQVVSVPVFR
jgi:hypothetical protein